MVNKIFSTIFAFALLLTQVAHALPQASPSEASPTPMPSSVSVAPTPPEPSVAPPSSSKFSPFSPSIPSYTGSYSFASSPSLPPASPTGSTPTTPPSASPNAPQPNLPTPSPLRATFDPTFNNSGGSMDTVACSDGDNGLATEFPTFGDVPSFPFIGGAFDIVWNSTNCGSCWNITNPATGLSIQMTAIDTSGVGFNLAQEAFGNLTNGDTNLGVIDVVATKLSATPCGS